MEHDERERYVGDGTTVDKDEGLQKVWGSLVVAAVYAIFLMLGIALAPGESRPLIAGIGSVVFILGGLFYIFMQGRHRQRGG